MRIDLTPNPVRPWRLFALTLLLVFVVEYAVMHFLPLIVPVEGIVTLTAVADALCLSVITAPVLWWLVVVPLKQLSESRRQLLGRALLAQEEERRRITRDLHDGVGQSLTSLLLGVRAIEESSTETAVQEQARDLRRLGSQVHEEVRQLVRGLRPTLLEEIGLAPAISRMLDDLVASQPIAVHWDTAEWPAERISPAIETTLYRIAQETISNAIQHAAPSELTVRLGVLDRVASLEVNDNGCGFDPAAALRGDGSQPFGLLSIRERAMLHNGSATIISESKAGTRVQIRIPLPAVEQSHG